MGVAPFCAQELPTRPKHREARMVVGYRKENSWAERAICRVRNQGEVAAACAGSGFLTLVGACKGSARS